MQEGQQRGGKLREDLNLLKFNCKKLAESIRNNYEAAWITRVS
jgi:hypothetical protein